MTGKNNIILLIIITGIIILNSCTCVQSEKSDQNSGSNESASLSLYDGESVIYLIPPPGEILDRFHGAGIGYNQEFLNPVSQKDRYIGSMAQSLNLGVYIADMAYLSLFERYNESVEYLEVIQSLSYEVGISSGVFESLITRAKANAGVVDSLFNISNEAFADLLEFLEEGGKENTIALISAGAYIESLYLALQSAGEYSEENTILQMISDMMFPLNNIMDRAREVRDDENIAGIVKVLDGIAEVFTKLETGDTGIKVEESEEGVISILGKGKMTINEENFYELKNRISEIRNNIVSN